MRKALQGGVNRVHLAVSKAPGHVSELTREAVGKGADLIAVLGGDGTVNEALQSLVNVRSTALLVLPGGTGNVLAHELGLPEDAVRSAAMLPALAKHPVRLGRVSPSHGAERHFLLMCGAGLDAAVAATTPLAWKRRLGKSAFWLQGATWGFRPLPQLVAEPAEPLPRIWTCSMALASRSRQYGGGLVLTPGASLLMDRFQLACMEGNSHLRHVSYLAAAMLDRTDRCPGVRHHHCTSVRLSPSSGVPVPLHVDGEVIGTLPARVSMSRSTLSLMMPDSYCTDPRESGGPED